jgi:hypothetical protein
VKCDAVPGFQPLYQPFPRQCFHLRRELPVCDARVAAEDRDLRRGLEEAAAAGKWERVVAPAVPWWKKFAIPAPAWALAGVLVAALPAFLVLRSDNPRIAQLSASNDSLQRGAAANKTREAMGVPLLSLSLSRGAGDGEVSRVRLSPAQPALVLAIEYVPDPLVKVYHATLEGPAGKSIVVPGPLTAVAPDVLGIEFQRSVLTSGRHTLVLTGVDASGRPATLGRFSFEVME